MTHRFRPSAEPLPDRITPAASDVIAQPPTVAVVPSVTWTPSTVSAFGTDDGGPPVVKVLYGNGGTVNLFAYDDGFRGGVRAAVGDVTGDGTPDFVTAAGPGGGPHVKVFDGKTGNEVRSFFAYEPGFRGGVEVAVGDVNRDGYADIITGAGPGGGPHVRVFDGKTGAEARSYFAFEQGFRGGVYVAGGDLNGDGYDDVIAGMGAAGTPRVKAWDFHAGGPLLDVLAFEPGFGGGVRVAAADLNADGTDDLITAAGPTGGPRVRALDVKNGTVLSDRFVDSPDFRGGVRVSTVPAFERYSGKDAISARTRTGDGVTSTTYIPGPFSTDWTEKVWVGDGSPPPEFVRSVFVIPTVADNVGPVRVIEGFVGSVAADGKSMTLRRGDGSSVTLNLAGDPVLPDGSIYIEGSVSPAEFFLNDLPATATDLQPGRWVRVQVGRARSLAQTAFMAMRVRVL